MATTLATQLAEWSAALRWGDLAAPHQEAVRLWLLDTLGVILAACAEPPGQTVLAVARRQGGSRESTLVPGGERLPAPWVALAHGTLAHTLDFDDTLPASVVHPGSVVVPTALAVGEAASADGAAVLATIAAGYEVAARLGAAAGRRFHARGFHASGVVGPLVAALVAGKLYTLPLHQTAQAMGLAGSMAGGLLEFLSDGSWSKRLHPGWAAHGGVVAAQLAAAGFAGPASVLEGRHGLYRAFLGPGAADLTTVTRELGRRWESHAVMPKLYPCAHAIHPFLDAALRLRAEHRLVHDAIASVRCRVAPWQVPIVCEPREAKIAPETEYQARASLPFAIAAALIDGRVDLETFAPVGIRRPEVLALAARITHVEDADLTTGFAGALEVDTREGRRLTAREPSVLTVGPDRIRAKFRTTAGHLLPRARVEELAALAGRFETATPVELLALCRSDG
ncbi:MAG: MmgE/PrpD family protein [Candidatus Rokubacteria bacterium]|nr:MmgE/PrpD family protein [Candidatus Rokubacteria bacterium]